MSSTKFKVAGLEVEMWETSFRVEGMPFVVRVGHDMTRAMVQDLVGAVYMAVKDRAIEDGRKALAEKARQFVLSSLKENA